MKQQMMKRILSLMLGSAMMMAVLTGCGSKSPDPAPAPAPSTPATSETKEEPVQDIAYPEGDITLNVAAKAGGDTDTYARILAQYMEEPLGVSIAITNNPDASGTICHRDVYNAEPDGYNAVFFHASSILSQITGVTDLSLTDDFTIISTPIADATSVMAVNAHKFASREDFFKRAVDGEEVIVAISPGTYAHLAALQVQNAIGDGANFSYVVVSSTADRITEMLADRIDMFFCPYGSVAQYCETGDFMCLGLLANERNPFFDEIPTFKEQGYDISLERIFYMAFPKNTDTAIVNKVSAAIKVAVENPACKEALAQFFIEPHYMTPEESLKSLQDASTEYLKYADILKG